jgi:hypothetical protein
MKGADQQDRVPDGMPNSTAEAEVTEMPTNV